ncbi:MAG: hypothetical protein IH852_09905 [Bacteroidetes bacterium]|nr:hypothetical protein [Bacteroidota bacterium]
MAFIDFIKDLWALLNSENNDPIIVGMIAIMVALIINSLRCYRSCKRLIEVKDEWIKDLREERNKYQEIALKQVGGKRKSSKNN